MLKGLIQGTTAAPRRIVLYGVGGIGKGTWAAGAPKPIFIQTEDGNNDIGVDRLPLCRSLADVQAQMRMVFTEEHDYRTLVIDSLDQMEPLIWGVIASAAGKDNIGEIGYGKGYDAAVTDWRKVLFVLDKIREVRGMTVILIAHAKVERFEDPQNDAYDRYSLQLHKKAAAEVVHWTDELLFANYIANVRKLEDGRRTLGIGSGQRVIYTQERPAFVAKSRLEIPPEIPMPKVGGWQVYADYFAANVPEGAPAAAAAEAASPAEAIPAGQGAPSTITDDLLALGFAPHSIGEMDLADLRERAKEMRNLMTAAEKSSVSVAIKNLDTARLRELLLVVEARQEATSHD